MRTHLLSSVEAHQKLGETEEEAMRSTLHQFGPPTEVAGGLVHAWRRGHGSWLDAAKAGLFGVAGLWSVTGLCSSLGHYLESHLDVFTTLRLHFEPAFYVLIFGLPALLGALVGWRPARGAVRGVAWGTGLGYVAPMVINEVIHAWKDSDIWGMGLIVLLQAACLTGTTWATGCRREAQNRLARQ